MNKKSEKERRGKSLNFRMRQEQFDRLQKYKNKKGHTTKGEALRELIDQNC